MVRGKLQVKLCQTGQAHTTPGCSSHVILILGALSLGALGIGAEVVKPRVHWSNLRSILSFAIQAPKPSLVQRTLRCIEAVELILAPFPANICQVRPAIAVKSHSSPSTCDGDAQPASTATQKRDTNYLASVPAGGRCTPMQRIDRWLALDVCWMVWVRLVESIGHGASRYFF